MSLRSDLYAQLSGDAGIVAGGFANRVYHRFAPQSVDPPYIVLRVTAGEREQSTPPGPNQLVAGRFSATCWASSPLQAETMMDLVRLALNGLRGTLGTGTTVQRIFLENEADVIEPPGDLTDQPEHGIELQFTIHYEETV